MKKYSKFQQEVFFYLVANTIVQIARAEKVEMNSDEIVSNFDKSNKAIITLSALLESLTNVESEALKTLARGCATRNTLANAKRLLDAKLDNSKQIVVGLYHEVYKVNISPDKEENTDIDQTNCKAEGGSENE